MLQGWLWKEKRSSSIVTAKTIKRWYVIEKIVDSDGAAVSTLSYYKSPKANYDDRCGWIFLSDVISLEELNENSGSTSTLANNVPRRKSIGGNSSNWGEWIISIKHPSRVFRLRAQDRYQHRLWFHTLSEACQHLQSETQMIKDDADPECPSQQMDKLKPAGAFHKDSIDTRRSFKSDNRDISAELEFMRSINRTSLLIIDEDNSSDDGKLVYDEELIRLGYIRDPNERIKACIDVDDDASMESSNDEMKEDDNHLIQVNIGVTHKQESVTKLDHRLDSNKSLYCGDETIQKRLQRAMQSDEEPPIHLDPVNEHDTRDGMLLMNEESSSPQNDDEVITMVKEFSIEDDSDESYSSNTTGQSFIVDDEYSTELKNSNTVSKSKKLDPKAKTAESIVLSTDANSNVLQQNRRYSFDSDCSFLPDHDFATSNWDSE